MLDYEIETQYREPTEAEQGEVEKKRCSITRLKHHACDFDGLIKSVVEKKRCSITRLKRQKLQYRIEGDVGWKEKMLDYEIETLRREEVSLRFRLWVEKKRCSITRLKRRYP